MEGVTLGSELLRKGIRWEVRNGERALIWKDVWLGNRPLEEVASGGMELGQLSKKVIEIWK